MQPHLNAHLSGQLPGHLPNSWLQEHGKARCRVCGLCVAASRGVHPTCRPADRSAQAPRSAGAASASGPAATLPPLEEVCSKKARTLRHVPKLARSAWAQALTRALALVVVQNSTHAWTELLMLPKCVLCAPPRTGRKHQKAAAAFTLDRLGRWGDGERESLWQNLECTPSGAQKKPSKELCLKRAETLAREGLDSKACAALTSLGLKEPTREVLQTLRTLHPQAPVPPRTPPTDLPLPPELCVETVLKMVKSFPRGSAAVQQDCGPNT